MILVVCSFMYYDGATIGTSSVFVHQMLINIKFPVCRRSDKNANVFICVIIVLLAIERIWSFSIFKLIIVVQKSFLLSPETRPHRTTYTDVTSRMKNVDALLYRMNLTIK